MTICSPEKKQFMRHVYCTLNCCCCRDKNSCFSFTPNSKGIQSILDMWTYSRVCLEKIGSSYWTDLSKQLVKLFWITVERKRPQFFWSVASPIKMNKKNHSLTLGLGLYKLVCSLKKGWLHVGWFSNMQKM